jgi:segregation and condensation protein B
LPRSTDPRTPEQPEQPEQRLPIEEFTDTVDSTEAVTELPALDVFPKKLAKADRARLLGTLEALLFASTEALTPARLAEVVGVPIGTVKECLNDLAAELDASGRPYELRRHAGRFRLFTRADYYAFLLRLKSLRKVEKLTPAALETLAIVAYRQPVIRAEVEAIRGVRAGPLLRALLDRKLVKVVGRAAVPGAPLQYGTTDRFLDRFGLEGTKDLPSLKEFQQGRI